jgi:hypothetical protein
VLSAVVDELLHSPLVVFTSHVRLYKQLHWARLMFKRRSLHFGLILSVSTSVIVAYAVNILQLSMTYRQNNSVCQSIGYNLKIFLKINCVE